MPKISKTETLNDILKNIQSILAVFYVVAVGVGMLFNFQKYSEFNINIFDYADVFDFLIAPFADFKILFFTFISIILTFLFLQFDYQWKRKYPKIYTKASFGMDKKRWYGTFRLSAFILFFMFYLYQSADFYGKLTKKHIFSQPNIELKFADNSVLSGILIGKAGDILFLIQGESVKAIPTTSILKEFEIK